MPTMMASTNTFDARRHHVAQDLFSEERGLVPERERHQNEARQRRQLELDQRDESWIASTKKHSRTISHARNITTMGVMFTNTWGIPPCRRSV